LSFPYVSIGNVHGLLHLNLEVIILTELFFRRKNVSHDVSHDFSFLDPTASSNLNNKKPLCGIPE